jgi:hypothetical protein
LLPVRFVLKLALLRNGLQSSKREIRWAAIKDGMFTVSAPLPGFGLKVWRKIQVNTKGNRYKKGNR